jgi:hypothetical protein
MSGLNARDLTKQIELLCNEKAVEFSAQGYKNINGELIWECVSSQYEGMQPNIHQIVSDILSLKPAHYMNWLMVRVYKGEDI